MTQDNNATVLRRMYGGGIHLYASGILYEYWWIVPVDWGNSSYTVSCFDPRGTRHPDWQHHPTMEEAIATGKELVIRQLDNQILDSAFFQSNSTS